MTKKNSNKEKIFNISIDLFSQYGYDGVSIRQIAKKVGIKESSIYNHYKSKEKILESILEYYIDEMTKEETQIEQAHKNLDLGFDYFYKSSLNAYKTKITEPNLMKITRIFLVESYHNEKIKKFLKESIIDYAITEWTGLFDLMKEKRLIKKDSNTKQLAESFYYYGLFLLYEHFIINYPEDDKTFIKKLETKSLNHMRLIFDSVKIQDEIIRLEEKKDYIEVENLVRNAFWNIYRPGACEHFIVHNLRDDESFIKELAYLIEKDNKIIGHINYSYGKLKFNNNEEKAAVLGPITIDNDYQNQGYGSKLIKHTLTLANKKDMPFVFVIGDENYYHRFGFETASKYNFYLEGTDTNEENPFFMIKIFDMNKINQDIKEIFTNPQVFDIDETGLEEFDKNFEYKEKKVLEGQLNI